MTDEQKQKLRFFLHPIDGIEKTEEMIDALEYFEENKINEKVVVYLQWLENKLETMGEDKDKLFEIVNKIEDKNFYLKIILAIESLMFFIYVIIKS